MKLFNIITSPIRQLRARMAYDRAVRLAVENLHTTGQRTYVIAGYPHPKKQKRHLIITDRKHFRKMKQSGYINPSATVQDLEKHCFYCTSYANGKDPLPADIATQKRKACVNWLMNG